MAIEGLKRSLSVGKTEYSYVYKHLIGLRVIYKVDIRRKNKIKYIDWFDDMEDAAIAVDKKLLEAGLEPVNKLKRKD